MSHQIENGTDFYVAGGTMKPDAPSYIERKADQELYEHILKGDFCCVLTPRQMGKSSLMIRTARRLKKQGHRTAVIDLTRIGTGKEKTSADQWYYGIAYRILRELGMETKLSEWWQEREKLPALQRLTEFFEDVLLPGTHEPMVIFVDEIDTTIALPFTDDFFAAVRACYNARAANPAYQRLNFVLLGVASPSDLIKDAQRTPFNIGHGIRLTDFTPAEAKPLSLGLCADPAQGEKMLARILYWTGGHPYLTQKLCRIAAEEKLAKHSDEAIDRLVEKNFLAPGAGRQEPNLKFVSDRLLQGRKNSRQRLKLYRRVYREKPVLDDPLSPTHTSLKLSGLVLPRTKQMLGIRNRIYERVFTGEWIKEVIPFDWNRMIASAAVAVLLIGFVTWYTLIQPKPYIEAIRLAEEDVPNEPYNKLKGMPFYKETAENIFAGYWQRRALRSLRQENREEGLLYYLKALKVKELKGSRQETALVIGDDYEKLMVTYRVNSAVNSVAFSPDGKTVLTGSGDGTARLWEAATGKPVSVFSPMKHGSGVTSVAFSPDGKTVFTGSLDGTARLWEAASGKPVSSPMKHGEWVTSVAFSPDGKTVLTGSLDGTGRLWEAASGKPVSSPMKHGSGVNSVAFSPDGKTIMAATSWWIHQSMVSGDTIKPKASRLLPGRWTRAYRFLDDQGDHMQVAVYVTFDSIKIIDIHFDKPDAPPLQGDPEVLLKEWQEKLALKLNEETGKIEPLYQ